MWELVPIFVADLRQHKSSHRAVLNRHVRGAQKLDEMGLGLFFHQLLSTGDIEADDRGPDGDQYVLTVLTTLPSQQFENVWEDTH